MACRLNTKTAFQWPAKLSRILDVDAAFRHLTCLAAVRCCEMGRPGVDWIAKVVNGDKTVWPYEDPINLQNVHAANILGAAFLWDGGSQTLVNYASNDVYVSATPGDAVFQDGPTRSDVHVATTPETKDEDLADAGAPLCMIGSKYPFRFWWQACNRAMWQLVREFPLGQVYDGDGNTCQVLPLCLAELPSGTDVTGPDDLLVPWTSLTGASSVVEVNAGERWLLSPSDIDFGTDFLAFAQPTNTNALRDAWRLRAAAVGFDNLVPAASQDSFSRPVFSVDVARWWRGKTGPEIDTQNGRLKQLTGAWSGASSVWADEFPYHGYSAFAAVLDYLESSNAGFALASEAWDALPSTEHWTNIRTRHDDLEMEFTPSWSSQTVEVSGQWTPTTNEEVTFTNRTPHCSTLSVTGPVDVVDAHVEGSVPWTIYSLERISSTEWRCDGDDGGDRGYLATCFTGGASALKAALNSAWQNGLVGGTVHLAFTSTDSRTNVNVDPWFKTLKDPAITPGTGLPFLGTGRGPCAGTSYYGNSYWFLKTSKRACIATGAQLADMDWAALLYGELDWQGLPTGDPANLPGPGQQTMTATIDPTPDEPFDVVWATMDNYLWFPSPVGGDPLQLRLPIITFQGEQVFPPNWAVGDSDDWSMHTFDASVGATCYDPNDYTAYNGSDSTSLAVAKGLHFVRYPKNVIYPN